MLTTTLSFENLHNHGELFANMLRARRELFIEQNKWDLPEALGMEYDQTVRANALGTLANDGHATTNEK